MKDRRVRTIELLGQVGKPEAVPALLEAARTSRWHSVRRAALAALARFDDPRIGAGIVQAYPQLPPDQDVRPTAVGVLAGRPAWATALLDAVAHGAIPRGDVPPEQVERLREPDDPAVAALADKVFPRAVQATSDAKAKEVAQDQGSRRRRARRATRGRGGQIFAARCGTCHALFGEGGEARPGPHAATSGRPTTSTRSCSTSSTPARRSARSTPRSSSARSAARPSPASWPARGANEITLVDASRQRTTIAKADIALEKALTVSTMPEGLLDGLERRRAARPVRLRPRAAAPGEAPW